MTPALIAVIVLALSFDFLNGVHDSSNIVATMISSRAFSPRVALGTIAIAEFSGPFIFGVAVANTIGHEVVDPDTITTTIVLAALSSAILWNLLTWFLGFPSSSSHALVGGIIGAVSVGAGWQAIRLQGLWRILIPLFTSPFIGFGVGFLLLRLLMQLSWNATPRINDFFKRMQFFTAVGLALSHGSNDAQKTMGIITAVLTAGGVWGLAYGPNGTLPPIPTSVVLSAHAVIALGTMSGGWRIVRTMGTRITKLKPVGGFCAETAAALTLAYVTLTGTPVSTTHTITGSIVGVGATRRLSAVKWGVAGRIVWAWILTIPGAALISACTYILINGPN